MTHRGPFPYYSVILWVTARLGTAQPERDADGEALAASWPQIITARQAGGLPSVIFPLRFSISPLVRFQKENQNPELERWQAVCRAVPSPSHGELTCRSHSDVAHVLIFTFVFPQFFTLRQNSALTPAQGRALPAPGAPTDGVRPPAPGRL